LKVYTDTFYKIMTISYSLYGCELWTMRESGKMRIQISEM